MTLQTKNFGTIEFEDSKTIIFEEGIPGFNELKKYIIIEDEEEDSPFVYLQSIEDGTVSFIMVNPFILKPDYTVDIKDQYISTLGGGNIEQFSIFVIATVVDKFELATVNLLAPIIIQNDTRKGMQVILEKTDYTTRHRIVELLERGGC